jgi:hypothetical protein
MKKLAILGVLFLSILSSNAQKGGQWQALSDMKVVMKQTFPPLIKADNLQPAKDNAAQLYDAALVLQNSKKPKAFRKSAMTEKFENITELSKKLKESVANKLPDEDIKSNLVDLHAAFAEIAHHKKAGGAKH